MSEEKEKRRERILRTAEAKFKKNSRRSVSNSLEGDFYTRIKSELRSVYSKTKTPTII